MDIRERLGARVKELREKLDISQKELAFRADLDRSYIAGIENGARNVSIANIEKLAHALECSLIDFFDHELFK